MATLDIFSHNNVFYRGIDIEKDPSFFEVVRASTGYAYDPIYESIRNAIRFRGEADPSYNPLEDIEGYERFRDDLMDAKNAEHMAEMKRAIDENLERREVLGRASFGYHFLAGLADPINLVALPFGGPSVGLARSFLKTGASTAVIQSGQEAVRAPFDPAATMSESAINVGSAFVAGGLLGTAISVPATRRAKAFEATDKALGERKLIHQPDVNTALPAPTPERPLSQVENYELDIMMDSKPLELSRMEEMVNDSRKVLEDRQEAFNNAKTPDDIRDTKAALDEAQSDFNRISNHFYDEKQNYDLHKAEFEARKIDQEQIDAMEDPLGLPKNIFTDSAAYKFITTPMKRVLMDGKATTRTKAIVLGIAGDSGILLNLHKRGFRIGPSVYQKAALRDGEWVQVYDELRNIYGAEYGKGKQTFLDYDMGGLTQKVAEKMKVQPQQTSFVDYITMVNKKRMMGEQAATDAESRAIKLLDNFYEKWEGRLKESGLIANTAYFKKKRDLLELDIVKRQDIVERLSAKKTLSKNQQERLELNKKIVAKLRTQKEDIELQLKSEREFRLMPANEEKFHPRYWNQEYIKANRAELHRILSRWYMENPYVFVFDEASGKYVRQATDPSPNAIAARADKTIDKILGIEDVSAEGNAFYGYGRSKHFRHRDVDIPNKLVIDFIETNPFAVMKAYTAKIAPQYEFAMKFGKGIDDLLDEVEDELLDIGKSRLETNRILRDIRHLNDRVQGTVRRNPDALNYKASIILKDLAMLNYLGSAGFATLPDFAKIMMEHEMGTVWKALFGVMSDNRVRMTTQEGRLAGEIIDILKGDAHMRFSENITNNPLNEGLISKARQGFFALNGVAPMTTIFKKLDAIARGHTLIDYSIKLTKGQATEQEIAYLARYNITRREAAEIANAPWDQTDGGLYLPNTREWTTGRAETLDRIDAKKGIKDGEKKVSEGTLESFRSAMNSGIGNTVLMGTPADKPIAVDGVFYIPMHIARQFGMKQDPKFKGYARIENGILSMPFQFLSYSFAAANKITASIAQGQVKNRAIAIAAAMGLGYMGMELKYKDWQMERMTLDEKIARSFDASGVAALYSDLFYTSMGISMALGGPDIGMGLIKPKFKQEENTLDAITGVMGAGPSYGVDVGRGVAKFIEGDYGEGTGELLRRLPYAQLFFLKDITNETARAFIGGRY